MAYRNCYDEPGYVYLLVCPVSDLPMYIGSSFDPAKRLKGHYSTQNKRLNKWLKNLKDVGKEPIIEILEKVNIRSDAYKLERQWINEYIKAGYSICNIVLEGTKKDKGTGAFIVKSYYNEHINGKPILNAV
jgi:predicted GIY-YIG superfamily endonuclease